MINAKIVTKLHVMTVPLSRRRQGPHEVHVDVGEALGGHWNGLLRRRRLPHHLGAAALLAVCHPSLYVALHAWPHHPRPQQPAGRLGPRVGHVVEGGEDGPSVGRLD